MNAQGLSPPTAKQIAFAESVAQNAGVEVPEGARARRDHCNDFIEGMIASRTPSKGDLRQAKFLTKRLGVELSVEALTRKDACRRWIEALEEFTPPTERMAAL